jgi:Transmembrane secretion effector
VAPPGEAEGYGPILRDRSFRAYWFSQAAGDAGYAVYAISIVWLGYRISGSAVVVGILLGVEFGVYAFSFIAGAIIDRVRNLRTVLLIGYPLQALGAFALAGLLFAGLLTVPVLLVLVALISFVWDFTWTANNAIPPNLVRPADLLRANSLVSAVSGGNTIAGYAVGGVLLLFVGPVLGQVLYGALNLVAALLAIAISLPDREPVERGLAEQLREGWRFLAGPDARPMRQLAAYGALEGTVSLAPPLLITLLSVQLYANPAGTYGLLFTSYAVGGVAGSLGLGRWNPRRRLALVLFGAPVLEGFLILAAIASAPLLLPSAAAWFGVGLFDVLLFEALLTYVQARSPRPLLARTITNTYFFRGTARAVGAVVLGALGVVLVASTLSALAALWFVGSAIVGYAVFRALRDLSY